MPINISVGIQGEQSVRVLEQLFFKKFAKASACVHGIRALKFQDPQRILKKKIARELQDG